MLISDFFCRFISQITKALHTTALGNYVPKMIQEAQMYFDNLGDAGEVCTEVLHDPTRSRPVHWHAKKPSPWAHSEKKISLESSLLHYIWYVLCRLANVLFPWALAEAVLWTRTVLCWLWFFTYLAKDALCVWILGSKQKNCTRRFYEILHRTIHYIFSPIETFCTLWGRDPLWGKACMTLAEVATLKHSYHMGRRTKKGRV